MVKVMNGTTTVATYAYDGLSRRVQKTTSSTRDYYYSAQWQILEERVGGASTYDRQFVWGLRHIDDLVLRDLNGGSPARLYALHDAMSVTAVEDTTGTVQERYGYNGFGQPRFMNSTFVNSCSSYTWETLFDAYRWDGESGFYQVRYRYLHPTLGRWLTRDPIYEPGFELRYLTGLTTYSEWPNRDPLGSASPSATGSLSENLKPARRLRSHISADYSQGLNLFHFVGSDPVSKVDIDGRYALPEPPEIRECTEPEWIAANRQCKKDHGPWSVCTICTMIRYSVVMPCIFWNLRLGIWIRVAVCVTEPPDFNL
jgi:RHS repeat-associated protein